jgi:hypothetical protein
MAKRFYTYYPEFDKDDNLIWYVFETQTEQIVGEFFFEEDAQDCLKFLEEGNAFSGFTPAFILRKTPQMTNINDAFTAEFT